MKWGRKTKILKRKEINNLLINVIQTRSKKIKTDYNNNLHKDAIQTISKPKILKRKEINNLLIKVIQTSSKKIKTDHHNNFHIDAIQTRSKTKILKRKEINNLPINVSETRSKKFKTNHRNNLHRDVIQTGSKKIKTDNAKNLPEPNCVMSQMTIPFQYLPDLVLEFIFKLLTYHEIAGLRIICRRLNEVCKRLLNRGYRILHQNLSEFIQKINALPKLFKDSLNPFDNPIRHLNEIDARLSMFDLAFHHHINANRCCFFPGKVLDIIGDYIYWMKDKFKKNLFPFIKNWWTSSEVLRIPNSKELIELVCNRALDYVVTNIIPAFNISIESTSVKLSSSTPFFFNDIVLRSALGNLISYDFCFYKAMARYNEGGESAISTMNYHLKNIKIKYDNPIRGIDRRLVMEKLLGKLHYNGNILFLVQWKGQKEAEFLYHNDLKEKLKSCDHVCGSAIFF